MPYCRIDFERLPDGSVVVTKMVRDTKNARSVARQREAKPADFDIDAALAWCKENDYETVTWPGGARAWHGKRSPVRTVWQIWQKRETLTREVDYLRKTRKDPQRQAQLTRLLQLDLAYYG